MTRLEENGMVIAEATKRTDSIKETIKRAESKPTGAFEELVTLELSLIASFLADISKSLAILADKTESEAKE